MIFKINKYNYKTKIIIKICKLTRNNQMFGLRIFSKQNLKILNLKLNKKHISFDDMQALLDAIGYDLIIDFKKRD